MTETATQPTQQSTPQPNAETKGGDSKSSNTAKNIVNAIQNKANGKTSQPESAKGGEKADNNKEVKPPDPNAGKEKYVVEGREVWLTPEQAKAYVQKGLAFEPRMDQLARLQQEVVNFNHALMSDPGKVLANIAQRNKVPVQSLVEKVIASNASDEVKESVGKWFYENAIEPLKLTPDQLKAREDAKKVAEYESREKKNQDEAIRKENQARVQKAMNEIRAFIGEAMKETGLGNIDTPVGAKLSRLIADNMRVARYQGKSITPKQAAELAKQELFSIQSSFYDSLEEEDLVKFLGEKNAVKVKNYFLKLAKKASKSEVRAPNGKPAVRDKSRGGMSMDDFHDYLAELKKNG